MWTKALTLAVLATLCDGCSNPAWRKVIPDAGEGSPLSETDASGSPRRGGGADAGSDGALPSAQETDAAGPTAADAAIEPLPGTSPPGTPATKPDASVVEPPVMMPQPDPTGPVLPGQKPPTTVAPVDLTPPVGAGPIPLAVPSLGAVGDVALIGDMDGDGVRDDRVVWRPREGTWWALRPDGSAIFSRRRWGMPGDVPLIGDFDSDGKVNDLGVWRPAEGDWHLMRWKDVPENQVNGAPTAEPIVPPLRLGLRGEVPLVGDFDGDGRFDDLAVWRPSEGTWWAKRTDDTVIFSRRNWGLYGDIPVVGDFDSDGKVNDLGVFRPGDGTWWLMRWADAGAGMDIPPTGDYIVPVLPLGLAGDVPLAGDFDGDGRFDDLGVWRPSDGTWWSKRTDGAEIFSAQQLGAPGDTPLVGDFDADLKLDDLMVWRPSDTSWHASKTK